MNKNNRRKKYKDNPYTIYIEDNKYYIKFIGFDKNLFIEMFSYSFFIFLGVVADKVNWSLDQFILGAVSGTIAVSVYSIASQLNQLFINLSTAVSGILLPKISKMLQKKANSEELTNEMIKVGRIQYLIIFLMASGLVLVGKEFIIWWAGYNYKNSYYVALLLILPLCIPLIQNLGLSITQAMNKHKFRTIMMIIMSLFNVVISYFLAKRYQEIGSALGTSLSLIICNVIIMNIYYQKVIKLDMFRFWKEIIKMTVPFIIPICVTICIMICAKISGIISVVVYAIIYCILYILVAYEFSMNEYERQIIDNLFIKLLKKVCSRRYCKENKNCEKKNKLY